MSGAVTPAGRSYDHRLAGVLGLVGAGLMLVGAGIWASTGTDLDLALVNRGMADYLAAASEQRAALIANLSVWIVGVMVLGAAGTAMAAVGGGRGSVRDLARCAYWFSVPVALSAFLAWLAVVVHASASAGPVEIAVAEVVGWYAYRADNLATALIVGAGPALVSTAGRRDWVPGWLFGWGLLAAIAGALSFLPYFVQGAPLGLSLAIVPVGIGWTLAAAVVLLRGGVVDPGRRFR